MLVQLYFTMLHESFHIIFRHSPESAKMAAETTRELLRDMKDELADQLSLITNDELLSDSKTQEHLAALIPPALPQEEREAMMAQMCEEMKSNPYSTDYIDRLVNGSDNVLVEELACDRQAWLNFVDMATANGCSTEDLLQFHLCFSLCSAPWISINPSCHSTVRPFVPTTNRMADELSCGITHSRCCFGNTIPKCTIRSDTSTLN